MIKRKLKPTVHGVGYVGIGDFKPSKNGVDTKEYSVWKGMLKRCYSEKFIQKNPTYKGCTVCEEWHNFQSFAEWFVSQKNHNCNYHLDKDILCDGNKIYSPERCVLAPIQINSLLVDSRASRGVYPIGVGYSKSKERYQAYITIDGKQKHLGYYGDLDSASKAYRSAKHANIKRVALKWKGSIDKSLFDALIKRLEQYS